MTFPYVVDLRSVLNYSLERYPDGAAGAVSSHRSCNGGQPSLIEDDDGTLLAFYQSESSHEAAGGIVVMRRSRDKGRTWDDPCWDPVTVFSGAVLGNPNLHCIMSSAFKIKRGPYKGRILCAVSYNDLSGGAEPYTGGIAWSDPGKRDTWTFVQAPRVSSYYTITICPWQTNDSDRVFINMYTRWNTPGRSGATASGAGSFCVYSDDGCTTPPVEFANSYSWAITGRDDVYATTGDPGCIASDPNRITEYKECNGLGLSDGRGLSLIRSDDSQQITYKAFTDSASGRVLGRDWYGLAFAFNAFNFPALEEDDEHHICCATRANIGGAPPNGNDCAILVRSTGTITSDPTLVNWDAPMNLWDPQLGIGSAPGCGPRLLSTTDSAGKRHLGVLYTWCNPIGLELFTKWRLEYARLSLNPESPGSYARYDNDHNVNHPSKDLTDGSGNSTVLGWWVIESFRQQGLLGGAVPTRWTNLMGNQDLDLVAGPNGFMILQDGSDITTPTTPANTCLIGGKGVLVNHVGNLNMKIAKTTSFALPIGVMIVGDRAMLSSTFDLFNDGGGSPVGCRWQANSGGSFFLQNGGVNMFFGPSGPPWSGVFTMLINGASSKVRINGVGITVQSGSLSASGSMINFRVGGGANANFFQDIREVILFTCMDLTKIAAFEAKMLAKHRVLG